LARIAELETSHFWFAGRRALVRRLLERHAPHVSSAVDVGCGTGAFLEVLDEHADRVVGIDPLVRSAGGRMLVGTAERLPLDAGSTELVTALDVLEHADDGAALAEFNRVLRPGGWAVATVPAFPFLWSERDELAGHRRRYRRAALVTLFEAAGFEVAETAYYQFALFPLLVASRIVARRRPGATTLEEQPAPTLNAALRRLNELEVRVGSRLRWPWGSTLALAARKVAS
jgi:ubiquinone/menaquinone biosynthesis C-methylase UbiE